MNASTSSATDATASNSSQLLEQHLEIHESEQMLNGLRSMFATEDDSDDEDDDDGELDVASPSSDETTEEHEIRIYGDADGGGGRHYETFFVTQSASAFGSSSSDRTGGVVWAAAVRLAERLLSRDDDVVSGRTVLELGCGAALASMTAARRGARLVVATDNEPDTLRRARTHAERNGTASSTRTTTLDWDRADDADAFSELCDGLTKDDDVDDDAVERLVDDGGFQVILASDVVYGVHMVLPLVRTIDAFSTVMIATRDGRRGVQEFRDAMKTIADFEEVDVVRCDRPLDDNNDDDSIPTCFEGRANIERWNADHTIYTFRRRKLPNVSE